VDGSRISTNCSVSWASQAQEADAWRPQARVPIAGAVAGPSPSPLARGRARSWVGGLTSFHQHRSPGGRVVAASSNCGRPVGGQSWSHPEGSYGHRTSPLESLVAQQ